jgi:hypothetical protein
MVTFCLFGGIPYRCYRSVLYNCGMKPEEIRWKRAPVPLRTPWISHEVSRKELLKYKWKWNERRKNSASDVPEIETKETHRTAWAVEAPLNFIRWSLRWMSHKSRTVVSALPDLNPHDFYLWGTLKWKMYVNNPRLFGELQENIRHEMYALPI